MTAPAEADEANESAKAVTAEAMTNVRDRIAFPHRTTERGFIIVGSIVSRKAPHMPPHVAPEPGVGRDMEDVLNVRRLLGDDGAPAWPALQRL